jgi:hypothetical protein
MEDSTDEGDQPVLASLPGLGTMPGRCGNCGHHIRTQGHRPDCPGPPPPPPKPDVEPIAAAMAVARHAALQQERRREQIHHYWRKGPVPMTPNVNVTNSNGDTMQDFISSVALQNRIIELILDGAPANIFDWSDPPTPESSRHNADSARRLAAIQPPTRPRNRISDPPIMGATEYGLAALVKECNLLAGTSEGQRNHQANTSAFNLGQLVASGDLPEGLVVAELWDAAMRTGLPTKEIRTALRSGLESGKAKPRSR